MLPFRSNGLNLLTYNVFELLYSRPYEIVGDANYLWSESGWNPDWNLCLKIKTQQHITFEEDKLFSWYRCTCKDIGL